MDCLSTILNFISVIQVLDSYQSHLNTMYQFTSYRSETLPSDIGIYRRENNRIILWFLYWESVLITAAKSSANRGEMIKTWCSYVICYAVFTHLHVGESRACMQGKQTQTGCQQLRGKSSVGAVRVLRLNPELQAVLIRECLGGVGNGETCYFPPSSPRSVLASKMPIIKVSRNTSSSFSSPELPRYPFDSLCKAVWGRVEWRSLMSWVPPATLTSRRKQTNKKRNPLYISALENASSGHAPKQQQQCQQLLLRLQRMINLPKGQDAR